MVVVGGGGEYGWCCGGGQCMYHVMVCTYLVVFIRLSLNFSQSFFFCRLSPLICPLCITKLLRFWLLVVDGVGRRSGGVHGVVPPLPPFVGWIWPLTHLLASLSPYQHQYAVSSGLHSVAPSAPCFASPPDAHRSPRLRHHQSSCAPPVPFSPPTAPSNCAPTARSSSGPRWWFMVKVSG